MPRHSSPTLSRVSGPANSPPPKIPFHVLESLQRVQERDRTARGMQVSKRASRITHYNDDTSRKAPNSSTHSSRSAGARRANTTLDAIQEMLVQMDDLYLSEASERITRLAKLEEQQDILKQLCVRETVSKSGSAANRVPEVVPVHDRPAARPIRAPDATLPRRMAPPISPPSSQHHPYYQEAIPTDTPSRVDRSLFTVPPSSEYHTDVYEPDARVPEGLTSSPAASQVEPPRRVPVADLKGPDAEPDARVPEGLTSSPAASQVEPPRRVPVADLKGPDAEPDARVPEGLTSSPAASQVEPPRRLAAPSSQSMLPLMRSEVPTNTSGYMPPHSVGYDLSTEEVGVLGAENAALRRENASWCQENKDLCKKVEHLARNVVRLFSERNVRDDVIAVHSTTPHTSPPPPNKGVDGVLHAQLQKAQSAYSQLKVQAAKDRDMLSAHYEARLAALEATNGDLRASLAQSESHVDKLSDELEFQISLHKRRRR